MQQLREHMQGVISNGQGNREDVFGEMPEWVKIGASQ